MYSTVYNKGLIIHEIKRLAIIRKKLIKTMSTIENSFTKKHRKIKRIFMYAESKFSLKVIINNSNYFYFPFKSYLNRKVDYRLLYYYNTYS